MTASISSIKRSSQTRSPSGYFQRNIQLSFVLHYIGARHQAQAPIKAACANFSNSNVNIQ